MGWASGHRARAASRHRKSGAPQGRRAARYGFNRELPECPFSIGPAKACLEASAVVFELAEPLGRRSAIVLAQLGVEDVGSVEVGLPVPHERIASAEIVLGEGILVQVLRGIG